MKVKRPEPKLKNPVFRPKLDLLVSEVLCDRCMFLIICPSQEDEPYRCPAYKVLAKLML